MAKRRYKGTLIPRKNNEETNLFVHEVTHEFQVGDTVIDLTAEEQGWPDLQGEIVDVDGAQIKVRYTSGTERWKMHINLRKSTAP